MEKIIMEENNNNYGSNNDNDNYNNVYFNLVFTVLGKNSDQVVT